MVAVSLTKLVPMNKHAYQVSLLCLSHYLPEQIHGSIGRSGYLLGKNQNSSRSNTEIKE